MASGAVPCVVPATTTFCPNHQVNFPACFYLSSGPSDPFPRSSQRTFALDLWSLLSPIETESDSHCYHEELHVSPYVPKTTTFTLCWEVQSLSGRGRKQGGERDKEKRHQRDATLPGWPLLCDSQGRLLGRHRSWPTWHIPDVHTRRRK